MEALREAIDIQSLFCLSGKAMTDEAHLNFIGGSAHSGRVRVRAGRDSRCPTIASMLRSTDSSSLHAALGGALADMPDVAFAVVFGSFARGNPRAGSDVDVALGFSPDRRPSAREIGAMVSRLEEATGRSVDVIILDHAPPGLAYRVFRDGVVVLARDRGALIERKVRAILEYLDFQPVERVFSKAVLAPHAQ